MSANCEELIEELTVQLWLLFHHQNLKYCTLFVSGTELRKDRQTNGQKDRRTTRLLNAPAETLRTGHEKDEDKRGCCEELM